MGWNTLALNKANTVPELERNRKGGLFLFRALVLSRALGPLAGGVDDHVWAARFASAVAQAALFACQFHPEKRADPRANAFWKNFVQRGERMLILPAIDIRHGNCVRLYQGQPDQQTIYSE